MDTVELRRVFEKYVSAGRHVRGSVGAHAASTFRAKNDPMRLKAIREWAAENGHDVSPQGRSAALVREAYDAAH